MRPHPVGPRVIVLALLALGVFAAVTEGRPAAVVSAAALELAPVAQVGGQVSALVAADGRLYVARGTRLEIHPAGARTLATPLGLGAPQAETLTGLAPAGDLLWVIVGSPGGRGALRAFDVHDPGAIRRVAELPLRAAPTHLAVSAGRAWLASGGRTVDVVDVSVPWAPRMRGRVTLPGPVHDLVAIPEGVLVLAGPPEVGPGTPTPADQRVGLWRVVAPGNERPVATWLRHVARGSVAMAAHGHRVVVAARGQGLTVYEPGVEEFPLGTVQIPGLPTIHDLVLVGDRAWLATSDGLRAFTGMERGNPRYDERATRRAATSERTMVRVVASGENLWAIEGALGRGRAWVVPGAAGGAPAGAERDPSQRLVAAASLHGDQLWLAERSGALSVWEPRAPEADRGPRGLGVLRGELIDVTRDAATGIGYVLGSAGVQAVDVQGRPLRMVAENEEEGLSRDYVAAVAEQGRVLVHVEDPVGGDTALLFIDRPPFGRDPFTLGGSPVTAIALDGAWAWVATAALVSHYDVADPDRPALVGEPSRRADTPIRALAASGSLLYVLDAAGVLIVDDHSGAPRVLGTLDLGPSDVAHLALDGPRLWAAWSMAGAPGTLTLALIDVSDPSAPTEIDRRVVSTAAHVFRSGPMLRSPTLDLEAAAGAACLTLDGASTIWRLAEPAPDPPAWVPLARVRLPWLMR